MTYIALLRGINVGGKAMVNMAALKACCEATGLTEVRTYINSGNIVFESSVKRTDEIAKLLEVAIEQTFRLPVKVLVKTAAELAAIDAVVPKNWVNDGMTKCDVLFLWPGIDSPDILKRIPINADIESSRYVPGAIIHKVAKQDAAKSRMTRIVGTELYQDMTIRNINTVRKLITLAIPLQ